MLTGKQNILIFLFLYFIFYILFITYFSYCFYILTIYEFQNSPYPEMKFCEIVNNLWLLRLIYIVKKNLQWQKKLKQIKKNIKIFFFFLRKSIFDAGSWKVLTDKWNSISFKFLIRLGYKLTFKHVYTKQKIHEC